jgi:hypothetical protein
MTTGHPVEHKEGKMTQAAKARIDLSNGVIELEGSEDFVKTYLSEFKMLVEKSVNQSARARSTIETVPVSSEPPPQLNHSEEKAKDPATNDKKKKAKSKSSKGAPKVSPERFEIHGDNGIPPLKDFFESKNPGKANRDIIAVIGYYVTEVLGSETFSEGQIEYAYRMLSLPRPGHVRQIIINAKNQKDYFEQSEEGANWKLTRTGEIFVADQLPGRAE